MIGTLQYSSIESVPNGHAKSQNKLKYSSQAHKRPPNVRALGEAKWVFATVTSHLCLTLFICHFIFLLFCFLKPHFLSLPFFFILFCSVAVKAMGINYSLPSTKNEVHDADLSHLCCHKIINKKNTHKKKNKKKNIITKIKKQKKTQNNKRDEERTNKVKKKIIIINKEEKRDMRVEAWGGKKKKKKKEEGRKKREKWGRGTHCEVWE